MPCRPPSRQRIQTTVKAVLLLALLLVAPGVHAQNAPVPLPCEAKGVASGVDAYRVVTPNLLYVNCDSTNLVEFTTTGKLYVVSGATRTSVEGAVVAVRAFDSG